MRRRRASSPAPGTSLLTLTRPDLRQRAKRLRDRLLVAVRWLSLPALVTGIALHITALAVIPVMIMMHWIFWRESDEQAAPPTPELAGPEQAGPRPAAVSTVPLPRVTLVCWPKLAGPDLEPMFVEAIHADSTEPWYNGGGIGLTRSGLITANNGRMQAKGWETQPGAVLRDLADGTAPRTVPDWVSAAPAPAARVAELAVAGQRGFVHRVYLRDDQGLVLASLPAAGLDGARLCALARAAGIHYRRYEVKGTLFSQNPAQTDCFPRSDSWVLFRGPSTPVRALRWARGEGESAGPLPFRA